MDAVASIMDTGMVIMDTGTVIMDTGMISIDSVTFILNYCLGTDKDKIALPISIYTYRSIFYLSSSFTPSYRQS